MKIPPSYPPDLSVGACAALVGVSRARVYQRVDGKPPGASGRPLHVVIRKTHRPGTRDGRQVRIPTAAAIEWREERKATGKKVGPIPRGWRRG